MSLFERMYDEALMGILLRLIPSVSFPTFFITMEEPANFTYGLLGTVDAELLPATPHRG